MASVIGKKFGKLLVIEEKGTPRKCLVRCDCGTTKEVPKSNLGRTKSCGCLHGRMIDLTGQRFGYLTVKRYAGTKRSPSGRSEVIWETQCDCGNEKTVGGRDMKSGMVSSCGCRHKLPVGCGVRNKLFRSYKEGALKRNLGWYLDIDQFTSIVEQECHYCGAGPHALKYARFNGAFVCSGIDRKDNKQGYISDNVLPACKDCNRMKGTMTYEEFIAYLRRAGKFQLEKPNTVPLSKERFA